MLKKLFKYDMKSCAKIILPFILLALGTTAVGTTASALSANIFRNRTGNFRLMGNSLEFIFYISILALVILTVMSAVVAFSRYYKNFFTDEGYLMFTLPVKTSSLFFSKFWTTVLWLLIIAVTSGACAISYEVFGGGYVDLDFFRCIGEIVKDTLVLLKEDPRVIPIAIEIILAVVFAVAFRIILIMLSITIGSVVAKKRKILASVGTYFLVDFIIDTVTMVIIYMLVSADYSYTGSFLNAYAGVNFFLILTVLFYMALCAIGYLIIRRFLGKKLNLA